MEIVERERPDALFPQSSYEVLPIARHRAEFEAMGVPVLVAGPEVVERAGDKWLTFEAMQGSNVPLPRSTLCRSQEEFVVAVRALGYPERRVCFKPPFSKGGRGFRILTAEVDRLHLLLYERADAMLMTLEEALDVMGGAVTFPDLMVMEYVEGMEHTVDVFCRGGRVLMGFVKTREDIKAGLAMYFEIVEDPTLWHYGQVVAERLQLDYFANIQFKGGQLLEVNPRVSTFVHQEDWNMPYLGLKYLLGEVSDAGLQAANERVRATRRTVRYYDQVFYDAHA
jgi:carbamoyl-phosphate synthase large subunit